MKTLLSQISNFYKSRAEKRLFSRISPFVPQLVGASPQLTEIASANDWEIKQVYRSLSDMDVLWVGPRSDSFTVMLHLPRSQAAVESFEQQKKICSALSDDARLGKWRQLLPGTLYEGCFQGRPYWFEAQLPGINAAKVMLETGKRRAVLQSATEAVKYLHRETAKEVKVDEHLLENWVLDPLHTIANSVLAHFHSRSRLFLDRVKEQLSDTLLGQHLMVSWIHGDYWPANILVDPDSCKVTGIIDWDLSQPMGLPSLDLVNLLVSTRQVEAGKELGEILVEILTLGAWREDEQELWEQARQVLNGNSLGIKESLLIFWIQHLSANLKKTQRYSINPVWIYGNFVQVINRLG